jgi:hypothetical protein
MTNRISYVFFKKKNKKKKVTKKTTLTLYSIFDKTLLESLQLTEGKQGYNSNV